MSIDINDITRHFLRSLVTRGPFSSMKDCILSHRILNALDSISKGANHAVVEERSKIMDNIEAHLKGLGYTINRFKDYNIIAVFTKPGEIVPSVVADFDLICSSCRFSAYGDKEYVNQIHEWFNETYNTPGYNVTTVEGIRSDGKIETITKFIPKNSGRLTIPSFYPWLSISVEEYVAAFMQSDENILVLFGPPGTGKSTFLRHLIDIASKDVMLAYNKEVVESNKIINDFYKDDDLAILAYEDIDNYLGSREDGNSLMATILNTAEGVLEHPGKKIIFSTNLPSIDRIDSALLRPGRCFDILKFELLTANEAVTVLKDLGREPRDFSSKDKWSLAEITAKHHDAQQTINRFGRKTGFF